LRNPKDVFSDTDLRAGAVELDEMKQPRSFSGRFAAVFKVNTPKGPFAVKCFTKPFRDIERRCEAISAKLDELRKTPYPNKYFVDFRYLRQGILWEKRSHPILKMPWAEGETLGMFLQANFRNPSALQCLNDSLRSLGSYLSCIKIAHGDIQLDNVMVSDGGRNVRLIDCEGAYVKEIADLGTAVIGDSAFQHPGRDATTWNLWLDRFSFIVLNLSIRILQARPNFWLLMTDKEFNLFKKDDFLQPANSRVFNELSKISELAAPSRELARICMNPVDQVPSLEEFLSASQPQPTSKKEALAAPAQPIRKGNDEKMGRGFKALAPLLLYPAKIAFCLLNVAIFCLIQNRCNFPVEPAFFMPVAYLFWLLLSGLLSDHLRDRRNRRKYKEHVANKYPFL
jgi:hypothetical protein